jgi:hypothetical protein
MYKAEIALDIEINTQTVLLIKWNNKNKKFIIKKMINNKWFKDAWKWILKIWGIKLKKQKATEKKNIKIIIKKFY